MSVFGIRTPLGLIYNRTGGQTRPPIPWASAPLNALLLTDTAAATSTSTSVDAFPPTLAAHNAPDLPADVEECLHIFCHQMLRQPTDETNMLSIGSTHGAPSAIHGKEHTQALEKRRAVLGCFYALQGTPYMVETLTILSRRKEYVTDESFVHQIRLQLISREIETDRHPTMPPYFYFKVLQAKLDGVKCSISPELLEDAISPDTPTTQRVEYLYTCLQVVKAAMDNFLKLPPAEYPVAPFSLCVQLARYIKVLVVLSTLNDPSWDKSVARQTVGVIQFVDQILSNIQVASGGNQRSGDGFLAGPSRVFTAVRAWCVSKLGESPVLFDSFDPNDVFSNVPGGVRLKICSAPLICGTFTEDEDKGRRLETKKYLCSTHALYIKDLHAAHPTSSNNAPNNPAHKKPGQWLDSATGGAHISKTPDFAKAGKYSITEYTYGTYCLAGIPHGLAMACPHTNPSFWLSPNPFTA
ncbi:cystein rich protein [Apiospora saccharicola]